MRITVEISDSEMKEIQRLAGERKKGPAIKKLALEALQLKKRAQLSEKFVRREWSVELPEIERLRKARTLW